MISRDCGSTVQFNEPSPICHPTPPLVSKKVCIGRKRGNEGEKQVENHVFIGVFKGFDPGNERLRFADNVYADMLNI
jgi:hypothetical protein